MTVGARRLSPYDLEHCLFVGSRSEMCALFFPDNFYGTPKPPAEPSALLLHVTDQLLPGARPTSEGKRKRNKSVSNMEKASIEPPEEEEEETSIVNGNGVAVTPGLSAGGVRCCCRRPANAFTGANGGGVERVGSRVDVFLRRRSHTHRNLFSTLIT